nr:hypothetical protein [Tanacetum cinerariifolium]
MEGNKSIQRSNEQRNLNKALVEAYEADKAILDTYGDSTILKRRREDNDQEGPSAGSSRGSKRQKEGEEPVQTTCQMEETPHPVFDTGADDQPITSASTPSEKATKGAGGSTKGTQSRQQSASESAQAEEPAQTTCQMEETPLPVYETGAVEQPIVQTSQHPEWFSQPRKPPSPDRAWNAALPAAQGDAQSWISELAKQADARSSFNELLDTPIDFSNFIMHRLNVYTLTLYLLAGPTYEIMKGSTVSSQSAAASTVDTGSSRSSGNSVRTLHQQRPRVSSGRCIEPQIYNQPIDYNKHALWGVSHWGRKRKQFYGYAVNRESARDVYSKRRIIAVTELQLMEWHDYKHLDWISVRRDDDQIYKFKEGDFKRLRLQDIEDMLLLLV